MNIPTYVLFVAAPINILLNYLLVSFVLLVPSEAEAHDPQVWGPDPVRLGFVGGAVATAMSYNLAVCASLLIRRLADGPR